ncbi:MAG: hypothetical protein EOO85_32225 [Pedobacter sp.]|nr:MAG: hypothetical protein EOO85_32225 [Pedobacter sp.]
MATKPGKRQYSKIEYIAGYEILGGLYGLIISLYYFSQVSGFSSPLVIIFLFIIGLYIHSIFSGILMFKNETIGITQSLINQFFQIISFSLLGLSYQYYAGLAFKLTWNLTESSFWPYLNVGISSWEILFSTESTISYIGINIVALTLFIYLIKQRKKIRNDKLLDQVLRMGS